MATGASNQLLISVYPEELTFRFELDKQSFCDLRVTNNTEHYVAFKVKTTSPKKYFVRPNAGVIQPWDYCVIRVTLQAQREYPPDMQCKDKFLIQSTRVPPNTDVDELPPDMFNKESGKIIEELKLKVVYIAENGNSGKINDGHLLGHSSNYDEVLQRLKEERDTVVRQTQQLQQELEYVKRRRNKKSSSRVSFALTVLVAVIGMMIGYLWKHLFSQPSSSSPSSASA